jgi:hypothetical protein
MCQSRESPLGCDRSSIAASVTPFSAEADAVLAKVQGYLVPTECPPSGARLALCRHAAPLVMAASLAEAETVVQAVLLGPGGGRPKGGARSFSFALTWITLTLFGGLNPWLRGRQTALPRLARQCRVRFKYGSTSPTFHHQFHLRQISRARPRTWDFVLRNQGAASDWSFPAGRGISIMARSLLGCSRG